MKYWPFLFVLLKSYSNSKFSLSMMMVSLIIAAAGLSAVLVINSSAKQSYSSEQQFLVANVTYTITSTSSKLKLSKQDYSALRVKGVNQLVAVAQTKQHVYVNKQRITQRRIDFTGIDTFSLITQPSFSNPVPLAEQQNATAQPDTGTSKASNEANQLIRQLSFNEPTAILHPQLLEILEESINANLSQQFTTQFGEPLAGLVAFESAVLGNDIIMDIAELYRLYPDAELSMLLVVGDLTRAQEDALRQFLPDNLKLTSANDGEQDSELTSSFHLNLMAMALLMFVVCLFIVVNAVNLLLNSRLTWLKICRQLGISRQQLFVVQLIEIVLLTLLASFIGVLLGIELAKLASPTVQATLENLYSVEVGFGEVSIIGLFIQVFGICLIGSVCATFIPLNKLNHQLAQTKDVPLSLTQQRFWNGAIWLSFGLFAGIAYIILNNAQALWLLLIATALVILSGCCLLLANYPSMLAFIQRFIPDRFPLLQLSSKQSLALSGKTKIACCAFFIAATSNIGMNLMVDSFRGATAGWLEQRLAADYYVYNSGEPNIAELAKNTGVNVSQRLENYISFQGKEMQQFSYPTDEFNQQAMVFYEQSENKNLWRQFEQGKGVLVNQQFAFGFKYQVNDVIELPHPSTSELSSYKILGIVYDFGNPYAQVLMPFDMFELSKSKCCIYALQGAESKIDLLRENMLAAGVNPDTQLLKTEDLLALSMQAFDNTFIITDGLNVVTLLVAALSLACAIIVLMNDIRPQNMLIRSMGVSALKTQLLALFQYLLLCFVALIFATPFGILLSWILIVDINYQAFSWTYPLIINPLKILQIYATSLLVVAIVIAIPIVRAGKRPLIEDIRWLN
ncbi:ABC transporter permease [Brumicola pallidula]|nr:ABC transporter permease [Glaciecola pallidula]